VWELATVAQIAAFVHPGTNNGWLLAFTPAGDMIATGGGNACCVLHHLQPLQMVQVASVTPKKSSLGRAGSACICADIAALSCGNKISAYRYSTREKLFTVTVPDVVDHLLEISPTGDFLAAAQRFDKSVHIFTITASPEPRSRTLSFVSACDGVRWSPGGTWLLAFGAFGVALFDGATFEPACEFEDKARYTGDCHIDSDEQYIASAGASNAVTVRKLPSPGSASGQLEVAHTFQERGFTAGLCFDTTGRRIAFSVANSNDVFSVESIKICSLEAQSFGATLFHIGAQQKGFFAHPKAFSPGDGRLLACWHSQGSSNENGITIIDTVEGKIVSWSPLLSTFFRGDDKGVSRFSVGWVPAPQDRPILPLLYVAIGEALWTLDVDMFQTALQDGCLSAMQLRYL
jgi:WD40 repeat protein